MLIIALVCLVSCYDGSSYKARQNVEAEFPNCIIYNVPKKSYSFIAIDSIGRVYYIECNNMTNDNITFKSLIHNVQ